MNILYSTDGKGHWGQARNGKPQCPYKVLFNHQCQGAEGHQGDHWCYGPDGTHHWSHPDDSNAAGDVKLLPGSTLLNHARAIVTPQENGKAVLFYGVF